MSHTSPFRPARLRLRQEDRVPIATYEKAVWRLVALRADPELSDEAYDLAVTLLADVYWVSDVRVRRDVRKAAHEIDPKWGVA